MSDRFTPMSGDPEKHTETETISTERVDLYKLTAGDRIQLEDGRVVVIEGFSEHSWSGWPRIHCEGGLRIITRAKWFRRVLGGTK